VSYFLAKDSYLLIVHLFQSTYDVLMLLKALMGDYYSFIRKACSLFHWKLKIIALLASYGMED